jgi:hypothetical protein
MCYYFNVFNFRKVYHFQKYIDTKIFFFNKKHNCQKYIFDHSKEYRTSELNTAGN